MHLTLICNWVVFTHFFLRNVSAITLTIFLPLKLAPPSTSALTFPVVQFFLRLDAQSQDLLPPCYFPLLLSKFLGDLFKVRGAPFHFLRSRCWVPFPAVPMSSWPLCKKRGVWGRWVFSPPIPPPLFSLYSLGGWARGLSIAALKKSGRGFLVNFIDAWAWLCDVNMAKKRDARPR